MTRPTAIRRSAPPRWCAWAIASVVACGVALPAGPWVAAAVAAPRKKLADGRAAIVVSSVTKGAKVYVDDLEVGEVPLSQPIEVEASKRHMVAVKKRGFATYTQTVLPSSGQTIEIEADLDASTAALKVSSGDASQPLQVLVDGRPLGFTPFDGDVPPGLHTLEVRATGCLPETRAIDVKAGQEVTFSFVLKAVPAPVFKEDKSVLSRWWFWTAVGAAVVGGVAGGVVLSQDTKVAPRLPDHVLTLQ